MTHRIQYLQSENRSSGYPIRYIGILLVALLIAPLVSSTSHSIDTKEYLRLQNNKAVVDYMESNRTLVLDDMGEYVPVVNRLSLSPEDTKIIVWGLFAGLVLMILFVYFLYQHLTYGGRNAP